MLNRDAPHGITPTSSKAHVVLRKDKVALCVSRRDVSESSLDTHSLSAPGLFEATCDGAAKLLLLSSSALLATFFFLLRLDLCLSSEELLPRSRCLWGQRTHGTQGLPPLPPFSWQSPLPPTQRHLNSGCYRAHFQLPVLFSSFLFSLTFRPHLEARYACLGCSLCIHLSQPVIGLHRKHMRNTIDIG